MDFLIYASARSGSGESYGWRRLGKALGRVGYCPDPQEYNAFYAQGKAWAKSLGQGYRFEGTDTMLLEPGEEPPRWIE